MKAGFGIAGSAAAAAIALIWVNGSPDLEAVKPSGALQSRFRKTPGVEPDERSNKVAQVADPARTLAQAFALEKGTDRDDFIRDSLVGWADRDAEAALSWVSSLEDPAARRSARSTVCLAVAEEDPRRAVTLALAHGADEDDDGGLLESLTMQWCEREAGIVLDWASEQPPGEWRDRLLASASFVLSKSDPAAAAQLVSGLEPGTIQDEAAMAVLHQWGLKDSAAALRWAEGFAEPTLRERALAEISNLRNLATSLPEVR